MTKRRAPERRQARVEKRPALIVAVGGEGVSPRDLPLRQLAELLEATSATIEAVAAENQVEAPRLSLDEVQEGSAAYRLISDDQQAPAVNKSVLAAVRARGSASSPATRSSMLRLHRVASRTGSLSFALEVNGKRTDKIFLSVPVEIDEKFIEEATVVHGRVVGAKIVGSSSSDGVVTIRFHEGGSGEFAADAAILAQAASLIGLHTVCHVTYQRGLHHDTEGCLEHIEQHQQDIDLVAELARVRNQLREQGVVIDAEAWRREDEQS